MIHLSEVYQDGRGVPQDYALARERYEKAAAKEEPQALIALASIYSDGKDIQRDHTAALSRLLKNRSLWNGIPSFEGFFEGGRHALSSRFALPFYAASSFSGIAPAFVEICSAGITG